MNMVLAPTEQLTRIYGDEVARQTIDKVIAGRCIYRAAPATPLADGRRPD